MCLVELSPKLKVVGSKEENISMNYDWEINRGTLEKKESWVHQDLKGDPDYCVRVSKNFAFNV
jgi:hypothetical protein